MMSQIDDDRPKYTILLLLMPAATLLGNSKANGLQNSHIQPTYCKMQKNVCSRCFRQIFLINKMLKILSSYS